MNSVAMQRAGEAQHVFVRWRHLNRALQFFERLLVFALLGVDTRQKHPRVRKRGVGFHALLADHHRFHEAAHAEIRLGERLVRIGAWVCRESMLQLRELRGAQSLRGGGSHLKERAFFMTSAFR